MLETWYRYSDMESVGDEIDGVMELEVSGSGVGLEVWSWHGVMTVTL